MRTFSSVLCKTFMLIFYFFSLIFKIWLLQLWNLHLRIIDILFVFPPVPLLPFTYPHPVFSFLPVSPFFDFLPARAPHPPWECDHSHSFLSCIAFARGHRKTAKNPCRYSRLFNRVLQPLKKWPPAQRFDIQAADRRSPIQVLTQRRATWLRWSPSAGHLLHTERCWCIKYIYIWGIPVQIDLAVTLTIFDFFFHVICRRASQKKTVREVLDFSKKCLCSVSPKITQKIENDTVDVIDLDKIWTVNSIWENKFF